MDIDCREQILGEDYADLIVEYSQLSDLEAYGYCYSIIDKNFATIHVPPMSYLKTLYRYLAFLPILYVLE